MNACLDVSNIHMAKVVRSKNVRHQSITQIRREEEAIFVHWIPIRVRINHKSSGNDVGNNVDEHDKTPIIPLVAGPAHP